VTPNDMGPIVETLPDEQQRRVDAHFAARVTAWTRIYEDQNVFAVIHQQRRAVALRWIDELGLPPGARILDVGCGAGLTATALARRGYAVVAIDTVPGMLERTRQTATEVGVGDRVTVAPGDVQQLDFPDGSFDLTLALGVLPWLPSPLGAMAEMARVVGRGGYVLVTADNRWRLAHVLDPEVSPALAPVRRAAGAVLRWFGWRRRQWSGAVARTVSRADVGSWLHAARLVPVRSTSLGFGPFSWFGHSVFPDSLGLRLHHELQALADRGIPGIRWAGAQYLVLARHRGSC